MWAALCLVSWPWLASPQVCASRAGGFVYGCVLVVSDILNNSS
jgi:hypothetical protein